MEKLKGYKTVVFFALSFAVALANKFGFAEFELSAEQNEWIMLVVPLIFLILRYVTNTEIFKKK